MATSSGSQDEEPLFVSIDIDIDNEILHSVSLVNFSHRSTVRTSPVCVCPVPQVLFMQKPKCFTPRFVGLGPYHHPDNLIMKDEVKLVVASRMLERSVFQGFVSKARKDHFDRIKDSYHGEITDENPKFVKMLIFDGLFLLALLHYHHCRDDYYYYYSSIYILNGEEFGPTLVNTDREELTMDGVVTDIFMLENQIPTLVLSHIIEVNFQNRFFPEKLEDLDSLMLNFCKIYSPLANVRRVPKPNHHLLHLMYQLVAPDPQPRYPYYKAIRFLFYYPLMGLTYMCLSLWIFLLVMVCPVVLILHPFLQIICSLLFKVIPLAGVIIDPQETTIPTKFSSFLSSVLDWSLYNAFGTKFSSPIIRLIDRFAPISQIIGKAADTTRKWLLDPKDTEKSLEERIPSASQLHSAKIRFKPAEGDIYSIDFDEIKRELYLPPMKLDATSEVILRNLAAYESLIKKGNLSSHIEFMRGLIQTAEDVKILAKKNIILTELSADKVVHIFKEQIGKSTGRPTEQIKRLQEELKKAKPRFDAVQNIDLIFKAFLRICVIAGVIVVFSPLLARTFQDISCSTIFGYTSQGSKRHQVDDHAGDDYSRSSM